MVMQKFHVRAAATAERSWGADACLREFGSLHSNASEGAAAASVAASLVAAYHMQYLRLGAERGQRCESGESDAGMLRAGSVRPRRLFDTPTRQELDQFFAAQEEVRVRGAAFGHGQNGAAPRRRCLPTSAKARV